ncbi:MAG: hypothetical protein K9N55_16885 [Phycisphaerae bacterium]|nr:hypothetical protein [Phycisphaerae bacterium]
MVTSPDHNPQDLAVLSQLIEVLDQLGIQYAIGGSLASSTYGMVRFTQDADITVTPFIDKIIPFVKRVESRFYVSQEAVMQANHLRTSFNLIHFDTAFKIDVFVEKDTAFDRGLLLRRKSLVLSGIDSPSVSFVSPEDVILLKLRWYFEGGEVSERQWRDIIGVLAIQGDALDFVYLRDQAQSLGLTTLLDRVIQESQQG